MSHPGFSTTTTTSKSNQLSDLTFFMVAVKRAGQQSPRPSSRRRRSVSPSATLFALVLPPLSLLLFFKMKSNDNSSTSLRRPSSSPPPSVPSTPPRTPPSAIHRPTLQLTPPRPGRRKQPTSFAAVSGESSSTANNISQSTATIRYERLDSLSLLTWNVWFDQFRQSYRYAAIVSTILQLDVDVACFQEVTRPFIEVLASSKEIITGYDISSNEIIDYGIIMVVKKKLRAVFEEIEMPSRMDRSLLVASLSGGSAIVGTIHLESLDNEDVRREQLRIANRVLEEEAGKNGTAIDTSPTLAAQTAILCGDFNFDSSKTYGDWRKAHKSDARTPVELENTVLKEVMPNFVDVWPTLKRKGDDADPGLTFDGATNPVCVRDKMERMRYDRIMVTDRRALSSTSVAPSLDPINIEMVGTESLDDTGIKPSDHYGLYMKLG